MGEGNASAALQMVLAEIAERPVYARAALDNVGSLRVLEKAGFRRVGVNRRGFAHGRGEEIEETTCASMRLGTGTPQEGRGARPRLSVRHASRSTCRRELHLARCTSARPAPVRAAVRRRIGRAGARGAARLPQPGRGFRPCARARSALPGQPAGADAACPGCPERGRSGGQRDGSRRPRLDRLDRRWRWRHPVPCWPASRTTRTRRSGRRSLVPS